MQLSSKLKKTINEIKYLIEKFGSCAECGTQSQKLYTNLACFSDQMRSYINSLVKEKTTVLAEENLNLNRKLKHLEKRFQHTTCLGLNLKLENQRLRQELEVLSKEDSYAPFCPYESQKLYGTYIQENAYFINTLLQKENKLLRYQLDSVKHQLAVLPADVLIENRQFLS